jgi:pimeloyl-ACP methyl ester carboxylesterase
MASTGSRPIVLVPGACLGGWAWREVAMLLRARGHDVYPVTLTGLGDRVHLARPDTDLETHILDVVNVLEYEALADAVLVGHSYAGAVVTGVADRQPQRLHALVYLDTGPLPDGMAIVDLQPPALRERQRRDVEEGGDGWRWPVPDRETILSGLYGSASGLREEHLRAFAQRGTAQPYATFTSPLRLVAPAPAGVRRVAIFAGDGGISPAAAVDAGDPRAAAFAAADWELFELATGHWAMLSAPAPLAERLAAVAAGPQAGSR